MALGITDSCNKLVDEHTFAALSAAVGARLAAVSAGNPAGLVLSHKFNSVKDDVTVDALAKFVKQQEELPTVSSLLHAAVTGTQKTNGTIDVTTVGHVVKFIMEDNDLPEE